MSGDARTMSIGNIYFRKVQTSYAKFPIKL